MKKKYIAPEAAEVWLAPQRMITTTSSVSVDLGEEGNQQDAECRRFWSCTLWDE